MAVNPQIGILEEGAERLCPIARFIDAGTALPRYQDDVTVFFFGEANQVFQFEQCDGARNASRPSLMKPVAVNGRY